MRKATEFKILTGQPKDLTEAINRHLEEGWEISGGILQSFHSNQYAQAIIKYDGIVEDYPAITELHYIVEKELPELHHAVSRHLKEGWKILGNLVVQTSGPETIFYQTMFR